MKKILKNLLVCSAVICMFCTFASAAEVTKYDGAYILGSGVAGYNTNWIYQGKNTRDENPEWKDLVLRGLGEWVNFVGNIPEVAGCCKIVNGKMVPWVEDVCLAFIATEDGTADIREYEVKRWYVMLLHLLMAVTVFLYQYGKMMKKSGPPIKILSWLIKIFRNRIHF